MLAHYILTLNARFITSTPPEEPSTWILATGFWNDSGFWNDTANWIDGEIPLINYFIVGIAGDSNAAGRALDQGTTTLVDTCYEWNGSALVPLLSGDISTSVVGADNYGSYAKQFAFDHNARTGDTVVIVAGGVPSATFAVNGNTNNWEASPTGVNYDNFTTKMDSCLANFGRTNPDLIIWSLGVNDVTGANTAATINTAMDSLMDRIETKYPATLNLWIQIGRNVAEFDSQKFYDCRHNLIAQIESHPLQAMCCSALVFVYTTGYESDAIHYNNESMNWYGSSADRYLSLTSVSNKWARGAIASHFTTQTPAVVSAMDDLVTTLYNNSDYFTSEGLLIYCADHVYNSQLDLCFMAAMSPSSASFVANSHQGLNGSSAYLALSFNPLYFTRSGLSDIIHLSKVLDNRSTAGTACFLLAGNAGAPFIQISQSGASSIIYRINDATVSSTAAIAAFGDNKFYGVARNGGTKYIIEDTTTLASASVAATAAPNVHLIDGAFTPPSFYINADYQARYSGKYTTLDLSALETKIQAVIDAH